MLLSNKNAVIYGAGGSLGSTIARAFAKEGATIFLAGRTKSSLEKVAKEIIAAGGKAETAVVDAMNEKAVNDHMNGIIKQVGSIDISFNLVGLYDVHGVPLIDLALEDFTRPLTIAMQSHFITSTAAARQMIRKKSGVILCLTATPGGSAYPLTGGFGPSCKAMEGFYGNLASEIGPEGVRVVTIRSGGSPDSAVFIESMSKEGTLSKMDFDSVVNGTMLKRLPLMADIANIAVFLASDHASAITGTAINATCGTNT
ncbi:MAG: SDR family oxidoreductase [Chitinophagaceae bacterium]